MCSERASAANCVNPSPYDVYCKIVLTRRFAPSPSGNTPTLETVGRDMGLSKERVRQLQLAALGKLRVALAPEAVVGTTTE